MVEKISIQIGLDGGKEVEKQLADIGKTGNESLAKVGEAGKTAADGIAKAGEASKTTGEGFDALIAATDKLTEATNKATEAHSKLSLETVKTTLQIAKYTGEITLTGVEIVQAVRHHDTLIQSLLKLASTVNTGVRAFSLLSPELAGAATGVATVAAAIGGAAIVFEGLRKAAEGAAGPILKLTENLTTLSANTGETFNNLQRGRAAFEQLGISGENFSGIITKINEATKDFDVGGKIKESSDKIIASEQALFQARLKQEAAGIESSNRNAADKAQALEQINKLIVAEDAWAKAEEVTKKAAEANVQAIANNLKNIIPLINQIVEGQKGITFDKLTTAATKVDALTAAMKNAGDSGRTAGQVLVSFIASADRLSAIQVGAKFGLTEEQVDRLQRSGGHLRTIDEIWRQIQSAGLLIPPESAAAIAQLRVEMDAVAQAKARLDQAMASTVIAIWAAQVSSLLNGLKAQLLNMASTDIEAVNSAFTALASTNPFTNTISELEAIGRLLTSIGGQATGFSWGEIVATGGLASTRQELEGIGRVIELITGKTTAFTWGELWKTGGLASTRQELEGIGSVLDNLIQKFLRLIGLKGSGSTTAPEGAPGNAAGGLLGGRGTGTSDSNLAWVSRGEYVTPARAVAQPGVLAFLEALRRSGGNLAAVLDGMGRFALGGMVPRAMPAFASGGLAGGMSNVTIQFPGLPAIGGLRASSDVVEQLHKAAALAQVRSGGRKPSRYS